MKNWKKPITIARHAYGDVYKTVEIRVTEAAARPTLVFTGEDGTEKTPPCYDGFDGPAVWSGPCTTRTSRIR